LGVHNVLWNSGQIANNQQVIFWGVDANRPEEEDEGMKNVTISSAYVNAGAGGTGGNEVVKLEYKGDWTKVTEGQKGGNSLAVTGSRGSSMTFTGQGKYLLADPICSRRGKGC
jgi:hypothetical protein